MQKFICTYIYMNEYMTFLFSSSDFSSEVFNSFKKVSAAACSCSALLAGTYINTFLGQTQTQTHTYRQSCSPTSEISIHGWTHVHTHTYIDTNIHTLHCCHLLVCTIHCRAQPRPSLALKRPLGQTSAQKNLQRIVVLAGQRLRIHTFTTRRYILLVNNKS